MLARLPQPAAPRGHSIAYAQNQLRLLQYENGVLLRALARAQQQTSTGIAQLHGQVQDQDSLLMRLRAALMRKETELMIVRDDMAALLDASQMATELVICQTGCVSHGNHWLDDTQCRRTGQTCLLREDTP
ncbi:MAG TPA: hypothetical protein VGE70_08630 [Burkholderiaceae bacterium]